MNRWTGTGHLTKDPKFLETNGGTAICTLRIAVKRAGKQGHDGYFDVKCFEAQASACAQYLKAGREVAIDGRLLFDEFETQDGSNRHAYWPLTQPLARDEVERANRRLAHALGADPASADAARILRVPATYSHKHEPPTPVDALRLDVDRRVLAADVIGGLPDPPQPPRVGAPPPDAHRGDDPLLAIAPDVYVQRLLGVEVPRHRKVPCPFHPDTHASLHVYDSAGRGWYCFGRCRRGGTIYDLAAPLLGYDPRGEGFLRLRSELRRLFGLDEARDA